MENYAIIGAVALLGLILGFVIGYFGFFRKRNGEVVIEMSEDGQRERIRFVIDMDLDEIKKQRRLTFKVDNTLSQK